MLALLLLLAGVAHADPDLDKAFLAEIPPAPAHRAPALALPECPGTAWCSPEPGRFEMRSAAARQEARAVGRLSCGENERCVARLERQPEPRALWDLVPQARTVTSVVSLVPGASRDGLRLGGEPATWRIDGATLLRPPVVVTPHAMPTRR